MNAYKIKIQSHQTHQFSNCNLHVFHNINRVSWIFLPKKEKIRNLNSKLMIQSLEKRGKWATHHIKERSKTHNRII
jgi:hypothetical protein